MLPSLSFIFVFKNNKCITLKELTKLAEAVADANKAIELDPAMHKAYYRKGLATLFIFSIKVIHEHSHNLLCYIFIHVISYFLFTVLHALSLKNTKLQRLLLSWVLPMHQAIQGSLVY